MTKDNVNNKKLVKSVQRNFYLDEPHKKWLNSTIKVKTKCLKVFFRANSWNETADSKSLRSWGLPLTAFSSNQILLEQNCASAPFMTLNEQYNDLRISLKSDQWGIFLSICGLYLKKVVSWKSSREEPTIDVAKKHVLNLKEYEIVWLLDDSMKLCK